MCSSAAVGMAISLLEVEEDRQYLHSFVHEVMLAGSEAHKCFGNKAVSAAEVLAHGPKFNNAGILCEEYVLFEYLDGYINRATLMSCLKSHTTCSAVLTCDGHSICISHRHGSYAFFDSTPSILMLQMKECELDTEIRNFIIGQCDVMVLSKTGTNKYK
jgi:hypothetical protein